MTGDNDLRLGLEPILLADRLIKILKQETESLENMTYIVCGVVKSPSLNKFAVHDFNKKLKENCEVASKTRDIFYYLDLPEFVFNRPYDSDYVPYHALFMRDGVHLSKDGNLIIAKLIASFLNPLIHKEFKCKAPRLLPPFGTQTHDPLIVDYVRMKGIYTRNYDDLTFVPMGLTQSYPKEISKNYFTNDCSIIGLSPELTFFLDRTSKEEFVLDFDDSFNYSVVCGELIPHIPTGKRQEMDERDFKSQNNQDKGQKKQKEKLKNERKEKQK
jgi:hypothetical protein